MNKLNFRGSRRDFSTSQDVQIKQLVDVLDTDAITNEDVIQIAEAVQAPISQVQEIVDQVKAESQIPTYAQSVQGTQSIPQVVQQVVGMIDETKLQQNPTQVIQQVAESLQVPEAVVQEAVQQYVDVDYTDTEDTEFCNTGRSKRFSRTGRFSRRNGSMNFSDSQEPSEQIKQLQTQVKQLKDQLAYAQTQAQKAQQAAQVSQMHQTESTEESEVVQQLKQQVSELKQQVADLSQNEIAQDQKVLQSNFSTNRFNKRRTSNSIIESQKRLYGANYVDPMTVRY